jgi:hypothetical protein
MLEVRRAAARPVGTAPDRGPGSSLGSSLAWVVVGRAPRPGGRGSVVVMTRVPLAGAEVYEWVALRRVSGGEVTKVDHRWWESDHQIPGYLTGALAQLLARGLVRLLDPNPSGSARGVARAVLTTTGAERYEHLCQSALQLPAAQLLTLCQRFIDNDPDPLGDTCPVWSPAAITTPDRPHGNNSEPLPGHSGAGPRTGP